MTHRYILFDAYILPRSYPEVVLAQLALTENMVATDGCGVIALEVEGRGVVGVPLGGGNSSSGALVATSNPLTAKKKCVIRAQCLGKSL